MRKVLFLAFLFSVTFQNVSAQSHSKIATIHETSASKVFKLERILTEVSGLVASSSNSVFAHNDEHAIVHEINLEDGSVIRSFAFGKPTVEGDFEGIALKGGFIYLVTSDGLIYEAHPDSHRKRISYNTYDTNLGKICEIEGIAPDEADGFLLVCKRTRSNKAFDRLVIYRWSVAERLTPPKLWLDVSTKDLSTDHPINTLHASGLERDPETGNLLILDSNAAAILEITPQGEFVDYMVFSDSLHPQAEGLAIMSTGAVIVADEGGKKFGTITVYRPD